MDFLRRSILPVSAHDKTRQDVIYGLNDLRLEPRKAGKVERTNSCRWTLTSA